MTVNEEPGIIKEFRELYDYVCLLGRNINQIHHRLENIEKTIDEVNTNLTNGITENTAEISNIKENMVNKYEFNDFVKKLKASIGEMLPPLPVIANDQTATGENTQDTEQQAE